MMANQTRKFTVAEETAPDLPMIEQETAPVDGVFDMEDAPLDKVIWLCGAEVAPVRAYWRKTRTFQDGAWNPVAFWAAAHTPYPVPFDPVGWLPVED